METPLRRIPPPPSQPPPENISRSGRVPPPKGAPTGGVRHARPPGRLTLNPPAVGPKASVGAEESKNAGGWVEKQSRAPRRRSQSHEESSSDKSSRGRFEDDICSERRRNSHILPTILRRAEGPSIRDSSPCEDSTNTSSSDATSSNRRQKKGGHHGNKNHRQDAGLQRNSQVTRRSNKGGEDHHGENRRRRRSDRTRELPGSGNNQGSNEDTIAGKEFVTRETKGRSDSRENKRNWDQNSRREKLNVDDSLNSTGRHGNDTASDSEATGGRRNNRHDHCRQNRQRGTHKENKSVIEGNKNGGVFDGGHSTSDSDADRRWGLCKHAGGDSQSSPRRDRRSSDSSSKPELKGTSMYGHQRGTEDDSDGERYEWNSKKYSWDGVGPARAGGLSDKSEWGVLIQNGDDATQRQQTRYPTTDNEDETTILADVLEGQQKNSTISKDNGKESRESRAREDAKDVSSFQSKLSPNARCGESVTNGGSSQQSASQNVSLLSQNSGKPAGVVVGKPIRGARWGEAIGMRSKVFDTATIPTAKIELKRFVSSPLCSGQGIILRCFVERNRSGTHKLSHVFSMYADLEDGSGRLLLAARKLLASKTAYYIICTRQDELFKNSGKRGGDSFLAKLRASTTAHTEYALFDRGENPETAIGEVKGDSGSDAESKSMRSPGDLAKAKELKQGKQEEQELRKELAVIVYNFDKKEKRTGKRRMEVAIPQLQQKGEFWEPVHWQPSDAKESMKRSLGRIRYQGAQNFLQDDRLLIFHQRESRYDPLSSCLVDFRGRATAPSVKNFQLLKSPPEDNVKRARYFSEGAGKDDCESDDLPRPVYLQMGKVGKDCFNVDVEWPLSLLQAFAICLSRFDTHAQF